MHSLQGFVLIFADIPQLITTRPHSEAEIDRAKKAYRQQNAATENGYLVLDYNFIYQFGICADEIEPQRRKKSVPDRDLFQYKRLNINTQKPLSGADQEHFFFLQRQQLLL